MAALGRSEQVVVLRRHYCVAGIPDEKKTVQYFTFFFGGRHFEPFQESCVTYRYPGSF
jgi:hypothetical protein